LRVLWTQPVRGHAPANVPLLGLAVINFRGVRGALALKAAKGFRVIQKILGSPNFSQASLPLSCSASVTLSSLCLLSLTLLGCLSSLLRLPRRVCCNRLCAMPAQHVRGPEQARGQFSPKKNCCDKQVSSWRHISCHTDKNRYYT